MTRYYTLMVLAIFPVAARGAGPSDCGPGAGMYGGAAGVMSAGGDPCDKGNIFTSLKVMRAYRDNEAFAFKHFEGKQLQISGRLIAVKRDTIVVNDQVVFDGYVALVTPDGKLPKPETPVGLEFRFPIEKLKANPDLACELAELFPGQFVTLKGICQGPLKKGEYTAVIFNDSDIVH